MSPETQKVLALLDEMADDVTGDTTTGIPERFGRLASSVKRLAEVLGADDVAERIEADHERGMVALFGDGYRERWARERAGRKTREHAHVS